MRALPILLLAATAALPEPPLIRTCGLHRIDGGRATWLGPGGHPGWSPDGALLYVEAAHGPLNRPPFGPLYVVESNSGRARVLAEREPMGVAKVSPSGRWVAVLQAGARQAGLVVLRADNGQPVAPVTSLGPVGERARDAYAWLPGGDTLLYVVTGGEEPGVWRLDPATGAAERLAQGEGGDGLWPAPDGRCAAVRVGEAVSVVGLAPDWTFPTTAPGAESRVGTVQPATAGVTVADVAWAADGSLWLHTVHDAEHHLHHLTLGGEQLADRGLPGQVQSRVSFAPSPNGALVAAWIGISGDEASVAQMDLASGQVEPLARILPGVPLRPAEDWPAPAPAAAPDGAGWVVALGRTDRWGMSDQDLYRTTDTSSSGRQRQVTRRARTVGPSGVVVDPATLTFLGRERPRADGKAIADTRPGTMRWQRPSPPRWVVLHHTATASDTASLNSLTSPSAGRIGRLYQDVTPGVQIPEEPRTIGVHYLVLRSGAVLQLAEESTVTRHAGTGQWANTGPIYDFNLETVGIEIVGNGNDFTAGQVRGVGRLVADICRRQQIPLERVAARPFTEGVLYHKDFAGGLRGKPDPAGWPWDQMLRFAREWLETTR